MRNANDKYFFWPDLILARMCLIGAPTTKNLTKVHFAWFFVTIRPSRLSELVASIQLTSLISKSCTLITAYCQTVNAPRLSDDTSVSRQGLQLSLLAAILDEDDVWLSGWQLINPSTSSNELTALHRSQQCTATQSPANAICISRLGRKVLCPTRFWD